MVETQPSQAPPGTVATPHPAEDDLVMEADRFAPRCLALIGRIRRTGEEVLITRRGKPVARLVPLPLDGRAEDEEDGEEGVVWDLEAIEP